MDIGELRHRIELFKVEVIRDDFGQEWTELVNIGTVWAKVSNLHGNEYLAAATIQLHKEVTFLIRYISNVDEKTTIKFRNRNYNIQFVDNIKYRNEFLLIRAKLAPT